jgi:hypothetical protein
LLFFVQGIPSYAANPDLISAPVPILSQAAWQELERHNTRPETVLHVQITAAKGAISAVSVKEAEQWPISSAEIETWINRHWKFIRDFSGTVTQPVSFRMIKAKATPTPIPLKTGDWGVTDWAIFLKAPKPQFPYRYLRDLENYITQTHYMAGVLLQISARQGEIVDVRIVAQKGPDGFAEHTVRWVRKHWVFRPNISGIYNVPIYYNVAR